MKKIEFYIGVLPNDIENFKQFTILTNKILPEEDRIEIKSEFDDTYGYYSFTCSGNWNAYEVCRQWPKIKSIEHFEE